MAAPKQDTLSMDQLAAKYSIAAAILNTDPTLQAALKKILAEKITDPDLQLAVLQESDWYKKNTDDWRKWSTFKTKNNATYLADLDLNKQKIMDQYQALGLQISDEDATKYADQMMMKSAVVNGKVVNYNQKYLDGLMANAIDFNKTSTVGGVKVYNFEGKLETLAQDLYKKAWDYGYQASTSNKGFDSWMQNSMRGLVAGTMTAEQVDDELQKRAMSMFPGLANQISQGQTLRQAADPWLNALANTWETDVDSLDLNDDFVNRVLNQQDEKGNVAPMNLYQAKVAGRKSPRWQYTEKAKEEYTSMGQKILQDFGFLG